MWLTIAYLYPYVKNTVPASEVKRLEVYRPPKYPIQIDSFLYILLKLNNLSTEYTTIVVPIISIGTKGYIGAAQVTGPASSIEQVKAVAQVEGSFNGMVRVKGLVPVDSTNPVGASRVQGVGVSALIDLKI